MIVRVAVKELVRGYRLWLGGLLVVIASSAICAAALAQFETAAALSDTAGESLRSMSQGIIAFGLLAALSITGATTNLAVASGRRGYALLQLAGFLPRQLTSMVFAQLILLAIVGTGMGVALGRVIAQPLLDITVIQTAVPVGASVVYGWSTIIWSFSLIVGVVVFAGARAAFRAGRVPPIEALREPEPPRIRMGAPRWVGVGAAGLVAFALSMGAAGTAPSVSPGQGSVDVSLIIGLGMLLSIALAMTAAALSPVLYPLVLRAWTALIPARLSGSWFLARRSCSYRITQSTAAITPLMVGIALPGSLYTLFLTTGSVMQKTGASFVINSASIFTILGPALLLAALGSAVIIFMTGRTRARDNALVSVSGGTLATSALSAVFEALIYVVTALLIAAVIFGVVGLVVARAFAHTSPGAAPVYGVETALVVAAVGAVVVTAATVLPALTPTTRSIPQLLDAE